MSEDFFYALITGWSILFIFWATIIIFIKIRKPPKSKLNNSIMIKSLLIFLLILITIFVFR